MNRQNLIEHFKSRLASAQADIDEFAEQVRDIPGYMFEWSQSMIRQAAHLNVLKRTIDLLEATRADETKVPLAEVKRLCLEQVIRLARYPSFSTSQTSNLFEVYTLQAFAEIYEFLNTADVDE